MEDGLNSEVFTLGDRSVVLRVIDHQPAQIKALDVVRGEVEVAVRLDKAKAQAQALGESFINGMKSGDNIDGLLAAQNLTWAQTDSIERVTPTVNPEIIDGAFIMPRPAEGGTEVSGFSLSSGDYVVIELQGVVDGTPADLREGEEQNMRNFLSQQAGSNDISGYILSLEARADIEGRESQLQVQDPLL
jgi:peptidyl-prolyl cis-trans isomerase D